MTSQPNNYINLIHSVLGPLISKHSSVALFDFPNHPNVGDSAIWLGEEICLKNRLNVKIVAVDDYKLINRLLPEFPSKTVILITGGGNFGDLYPHHQNLREKVIADYRDYRVIQLPQSIHFQNKEKKIHCQKILNGHKDFHLLVRDSDSLIQAKMLHDGPSYLCPDMALCLGFLQRPVIPKYDIVFLLRTDKEKVTEDVPLEQQDDSMWVGDWLDEPDSLLKKIVVRIDRLHAKYPKFSKLLFKIKRPFYGKLAKERLLRGSTLLSSGRIVVTDRLHAHILCFLLNIPHVVLDNSYRKIGNFRDAWGTGGEKCLVAEKLDDAITKANELLELR